MSQMMPMKTIRMMLVSAISDNWVVVLDFLILQDKTQYMYILAKYKIDLHSLRNRLEKLALDLLVYLFLKIVQINLIFSDNIRILYISFCNKYYN